MKQNSPRIRYLLACEEAKLVNDHLDCKGIFEELAVESFPAEVKFHVVLGLDRLPPDKDVTVGFRLQSPGKTKSLSPNVTLAHDSRDPSPVVLMPVNLTFQTPGRYELSVIVNDRVSPSYDLWFVEKATKNAAAAVDTDEVKL